MGAGFMLMLVAVLAKFIDALCHLIVPTPKARHAPVSKHISLVSYLKETVDNEGDQMQMRSVDSTC